MQFDLITFFLFLTSHSVNACINVGQKENKRIVNGMEENYGETTFMAQVESKDPDGKVWDFECGATIISRNVVMTVKSCAEIRSGRKGSTKMREIRIRSGSAKLDHGGQIHKVVNMSAPEHENWMDPKDYLRLLQVTPDFEDKPIGGIADKEPKVGTQASIFGWGQETTDGENEKEIHEAVIKIADRKECEKLFHDDMVAATVNEYVLCSTQFGDGVCYSDEGGPLVVDNIAVGLVATPGRCEVQGFPALHVNLYKFKDFIDQQVKQWA